MQAFILKLILFPNLKVIDWDVDSRGLASSSAENQMWTTRKKFFFVVFSGRKYQANRCSSRNIFVVLRTAKGQLTIVESFNSNFEKYFLRYFLCSIDYCDWDVVFGKLESFLILLDVFWKYYQTIPNTFCFAPSPYICCSKLLKCFFFRCLPWQYSICEGHLTVELGTFHWLEFSESGDAKICK